jgi:hypothetical protein
MAINLDKMRKKLDALNTKGGERRNFFWKPQDGEQTLRIVPDPDGDPFKEFWFHYGVADEPGFLCPKKNHGDDCPVCKFVSELYATKDEEDRKMANQLRAKQRFFSPVIVRGEEEKGVRLWGYSKTVYQKLLQPGSKSRVRRYYRSRGMAQILLLIMVRRQVRCSLLRTFNHAAAQVH